MTSYTSGLRVQVALGNPSTYCLELTCRHVLNRKFRCEGIGSCQCCMPARNVSEQFQNRATSLQARRGMHLERSGLIVGVMALIDGLEGQTEARE